MRTRTRRRASTKRRPRHNRYAKSKTRRSHRTVGGIRSSSDYFPFPGDVRRFDVVDIPPEIEELEEFNYESNVAFEIDIDDSNLPHIVELRKSVDDPITLYLNEVGRLQELTPWIQQARTFSIPLGNVSDIDVERPDWQFREPTNVVLWFREPETDREYFGDTFREEDDSDGEEEYERYQDGDFAFPEDVDWEAFLARINTRLSFISFPTCQNTVSYYVMINFSNRCREDSAFRNGFRNMYTRLRERVPNVTWVTNLNENIALPPSIQQIRETVFDTTVFGNPPRRGVV